MILRPVVVKYRSKRPGTVKPEHGIVHDRARRFGMAVAVLSMALFAIDRVNVRYGHLGFQVTSALSHAGVSNPLRTTTVPLACGWLGN